MDNPFEDRQLRSFYNLAHLGRLLLMLLLAATFVGTTGQAIWQMVQPTDSLKGMIVDVAETHVNNRYAIYNLVVRTDEAGLQTIQLVNNGRILNYLSDHDEVVPSQAIIHYQRGKVTVLDLLVGSGLTIRESRVPPLVRLLIGLVPLLILVFHVRPGLIGNPGRHAEAG